MNLGIIKAVSALPLLVLGTTHADAQTIGGELGLRSRASIRIEASVMPTFKLSDATSVPSLSSNAPSLRYSLVVVDADRASRPAGTSGSPPRSLDEPLLTLVVPD